MTLPAFSCLSVEASISTSPCSPSASYLMYTELVPFLLKQILILLKVFFSHLSFSVHYFGKSPFQCFSITRARLKGMKCVLVSAVCYSLGTSCTLISHCYIFPIVSLLKRHSPKNLISPGPLPSSHCLTSFN